MTNANPSPRLWTWYWKAALAHDVSEQLVLVRISLGKPRWLRSEIANEIPYISQLAPLGLLKIEDTGEFARRYRRRLDRIGADVINTRFEQLRDLHDGLPLALLCFEHNPADCHRTTFAEWWREQTGEVVPERPVHAPRPARAAASEPKPKPEQGSLI